MDKVPYNFFYAFPSPFTVEKREDGNGFDVVDDLGNSVCTVMAMADEMIVDLLVETLNEKSKESIMEKGIFDLNPMPWAMVFRGGFHIIEDSAGVQVGQFKSCETANALMAEMRTVYQCEYGG